MLTRVMSFGLLGLDGFPIQVETDVSDGLPSWEIVGLPDAAVKESRERVRLAIRHSGAEYPAARITINLAPADFRKEGPSFDLAIAVGILSATNQLSLNDFENAIFLGELGLNGEIRPVSGVLPMAIEAMRRGINRFVLPGENADEASYLEGAEVFAASNLASLISSFTGRAPISFCKTKIFSPTSVIASDAADMKFIKGQQAAKRAMEVAVSGGHNILMVGPPGSGKSMLAKSVATILPDMSFEEALEVTKIHSVAGELKESGIVLARPFCSPHHSASMAALIGGGTKARPGSASLAHGGVLFLDEVCEFSRDALEALRQPLEDGLVSIARVNAKVNYPARFMLVAAMNPCPCGQFGTGECHCTPWQIKKYLSRISGPLLDRIDLHIEVGRIEYGELSGEAPAEDSRTIRERVNQVRALQRDRYRQNGIYCNAQLSGQLFEKWCKPDNAAAALLSRAYNQMKLSARSYKRILTVARTIADMSGDERIGVQQIAEAVQYRALDRKYWGNGD